MHWNIAQLIKCSHLLLPMESRQDTSGDNHPPASGRQVWTFYSQQNYLEDSWRGTELPSLLRWTPCVEFRSGIERNLWRCTGELLWCWDELSSQKIWEGSWHGIGTQTKSVGYLWACGISSRCPRPRGFSWADRTLCTFPATAMCAQAFSVLFTYLAKERAAVVSRQLSSSSPLPSDFQHSPWFFLSVLLKQNLLQCVGKQSSTPCSWAHGLGCHKRLLPCSNVVRWHQPVTASSEAHQRSMAESAGTLFMTEN